MPAVLSTWHSARFYLVTYICRFLHFFVGYTGCGFLFMQSVWFGIRLMQVSLRDFAYDLLLCLSYMFDRFTRVFLVGSLIIKSLYLINKGQFKILSLSLFGYIVYLHGFVNFIYIISLWTNSFIFLVSYYSLNVEFLAMPILLF